MKLSDIAKNSTLVLGKQAIAGDAELAREIQARLMLAGLLDPPVDGAFGPVSAWALSAFAAGAGIQGVNGLDAKLAAALLTVEPGTLKPIDTGAGDLAARIVRAMEARGYWISRHPDCVSIVYLEGSGIDGVLNGDAPNKFNDARFVLRIAGKRKPEIVGAWEATTEPGRYYTANPLNARGAARIAFDQYKAWSIGTHKDHEALVQTANVTVFRDLDKNFKRPGDKPYTGTYGINQHWGYDLPKEDIGKASAGCLVGRTKKGHREFMALVKADPRYHANNAYRFQTAILPAEEVAAAKGVAPVAAPVPLVAPVPAEAVPPGPSEAWIEVGLRVTGQFETSGNPLAGVTGDFDRMGISLGVLQWNIGQASLQPLVKPLGRAVVVAAMPVYGGELWNACNSDVPHGLAIVRGWQNGTTLRPPVLAELKQFTGGTAFVAQQMAAARQVARSAYAAAVAYAAQDPAYGKVSKWLFCWFFDLYTQNGGLKGLTYADAVAFINGAGATDADDAACDWLMGRPPGEAGYRDAHENAKLWRGSVRPKALPLFVLSFLRSQKSNPAYRGDVLNRKGTITLGRGWVHRELRDIKHLFKA